MTETTLSGETTVPRLDGGSFRDREGRVFYLADVPQKVYRALSRRAWEEWEALSATRFFERFSQDGRIVATRPAELSAEDLAATASHDSAPPWAGALEHERIPFISYPYEWSFSMLRDAAVLQLDLLLAALGEDLILKDSSSYNIQWRGARPTFIDLASFERWTAGDPWVGYLQFCQLFLYPLFLTAYRDVPFQPWLRGAIDGITPEACNQLLSWRDRFRPGVLKDVYLQAKLQAGQARRDQAGREPQSLRTELRQAGFGKELIVHNVRRLRKIVGGLTWRRQTSEWAAYATDNSYDRENARIKEDFVREVAESRSWNLAWDLGCNTGTFSRLVAPHCAQVVALDADHLAIDRLFRELRDDGPENILPLVGNLADASPGLGWRFRERRALTDRSRPDLVLSLALIHHVVLTANIPLPEFVGWLAELGAELVIEFVTKDDAMVKKLLRNKDDIYHDYEVDVFEACLRAHYDVVRQQSLQEGSRVLYHARPRSEQ